MTAIPTRNLFHQNNYFVPTNKTHGPLQACQNKILFIEDFYDSCPLECSHNAGLAFYNTILNAIRKQKLVEFKI